MIAQDCSQFALHARAILGLPIPNIVQHGPSASCVLLVEGTSSDVSFSGLDEALAFPDTQLRLFGKPNVSGKRRMGVALARDDSIEKAREKARQVIGKIKVEL
jgi:phosphoribosylglycinamide formyltransferase 2